MNSGEPRDDFEKELFEALPKLRRFSYTLARDMTRSEELFGETVVKMIAHKGSYVLGSNLVAWGRFIMKNVFFSERRRAWRSTEMSDDLLRTLTVRADAHDRLELKEVLEAMRYLPPEMAEAVLMLAEGLSYEEAAAELGVEAGTVKSRVSRGREMLTRLFDA